MKLQLFKKFLVATFVKKVIEPDAIEMVVFPKVRKKKVYKLRLVSIQSFNGSEVYPDKFPLPPTIVPKAMQLPTSVRRCIQRHKRQILKTHPNFLIEF
jgi:hypothetical protein